MVNAFLAALLKVAAEERQRAACLEVEAEDFRVWRSRIGSGVADRCESLANEHHGRAEVYESFAHRLIADAASDLILAEFQKLTGPAELLSPSTEIPFVEFDLGYKDFSAQMRYYRMFGPPGFRPQSPVIVTGLTN